MKGLRLTEDPGPSASVSLRLSVSLSVYAMCAHQCHARILSILHSISPIATKATPALVAASRRELDVQQERERGPVLRARGERGTANAPRVRELA